MSQDTLQILTPTAQERDRLLKVFPTLKAVAAGSWRVAFASNPHRAVAAAAAIAWESRAMVAVDTVPRFLLPETIRTLIEPLIEECHRSGASQIETVLVPADSILATLLVRIGATETRRVRTFEGPLDGLQQRAEAGRERATRFLAIASDMTWGTPFNEELPAIASRLGEAGLVIPNRLRIDFSGGNGGYDPALAWVARRAGEIVGVLLCAVHGPVLVVEARWVADSLSAVTGFGLHLPLAEAILNMARAHGCTKLRFLADSVRHGTTAREAVRLGCAQSTASIVLRLPVPGR